MPALLLNALVPLVLLLVLGFALKRRHVVADAFWPSLDRLTYWVFFPSLLFVSMATGEGGLDAGGRIVASVWGGLALVALATWLARGRLAATGPAFTSVFQGAIRFNSFVAFLVVPVLYPGSEGQTALMVAATVPFVNVLSVTVLARYGDGAELRVGSLATSILTNPLIVSSVLGVVVGRVGLPLGPLEGGLRMLGQVALVSGLLSAGATLRFRHVREGWRQIASTMGLKLAGLPLATAGVGAALGLPAAALAPLVLFQAMPTASSSYVLARAMRGDAELMASILAIHTVATVAWLPVVYALIQRFA
ncbi:MAG: AEC family transporter [Deinococcus-Thermus bacterium]|nr:AEC family transporter [Deinococcota bacterium]